MARIKIENIIEHLDYDIRRALRDTIDKILPDIEYDERELFREFKRAIARKCSAWERVPDRFIDIED